ncbi:MAG: hypothetical protein JXB29_07875 [Sedimentisphaerales bacterium]|nr:hypothetical protein [Sedimentisphaerales bacterium]
MAERIKDLGRKLKKESLKYKEAANLPVKRLLRTIIGPFGCRHYCLWISLLLGMIFTFGGDLIFADTNSNSAKLARYRFFQLNHITAEQGKEYLSKAGIGTVSLHPKPNTLLVTGQPEELNIAAAILGLVDNDEKYEIIKIAAVSQANDLPDRLQLETAIGDISIGTFSEPLLDSAKAKIIIDVLGEQVVAIVPKDRAKRLVTAIENIQHPDISAAKAGEEPNKGPLPEPNEDELFGRMLASLAEAEKNVAKQAEEVPNPNEPNLADIPSVSKEPNELSQSVQTTSEPNLPVAIEESLQADVTETAVEIEQPNEPMTETKGEPVGRRPYSPEPVALAEDELELNLPEMLDIVLLLDLVHKHLDLDLMYDPAEVKGQVALRVQGPIKIKELYPLLESVLKFRGFGMTRKGNLVTVVSAAKIYDIDPTLVDAGKGGVQYGDVIITRIFELEHIDTASAKNFLDKMKLGANITEIPETGTIIVTGFAYRMERIEELLKMVDKPGEDRQFRFRQLKYTMAKNLAAQVKTLVEQMGEVSVTIAKTETPQPARPSPRAARRAPTPRREPQPTEQPSKPSVYLDADERTNRILMIGLKGELDMVDYLIDTLDVVQKDLRELRLYEIQYVDAEEVTKKLSELGIISGQRTTSRTITERPRTTRTTAKQPTAKTPTPTPATGEAPLVEEPQVVIIEPTNSLLINATPEQHLQISTIIGYVDSETEQASIPYEIYPLENQDPEELAGVLNQLIQETAESKEDKGGKIVKTTTKKFEEDITIIPDSKTYSLIVYASKKNQQWISTLIKQLDEYRPQVLLDVTLVEITKNDEFNYDLNIISSFPDLVNTSGLTGTIVGGESPITSSDIITKLNSKGMEQFADFQSDGGSWTAFYGDYHVNVLLTAMQKKNYGRVLARPKLLVNDNEAGSIKAEETIHITREKVTYRKGPDEQDIPITEKEFLPYDAGITLDIEPHISKGDQLRLSITMTRKDFRITEEVTTEKKPPDVVTSDVTTVVTVPDGKTIILGGLERLNQGKGGTKVPILGDIPVIGGLFRSTANTDSQSRLYVFVKAHIIRPGEEFASTSDIELVSAKNKAAFEKYEAEMQKYEDWPGFKPEPMDPEKILEAD